MRESRGAIELPMNVRVVSVQVVNRALSTLELNRVWDYSRRQFGGVWGP